MHLYALEMNTKLMNKIVQTSLTFNDCICHKLCSIHVHVHCLQNMNFELNSECTILCEDMFIIER